MHTAVDGGRSLNQLFNRRLCRSGEFPNRAKSRVIAFQELTNALTRRVGGIPHFYSERVHRHARFGINILDSGHDALLVHIIRVLLISHVVSLWTIGALVNQVLAQMHIVDD
jgi:hypothetical protein